MKDDYVSILHPLTHAVQTGAIVAAPTFGLPEEIGGVRNWDYRYVWIRDSAFTIYAFIRIGLTGEAESYMRYLKKLPLHIGCKLHAFICLITLLRWIEERLENSVGY